MPESGGCFVRALIKAGQLSQFIQGRTLQLTASSSRLEMKVESGEATVEPEDIINEWRNRNVRDLYVLVEREAQITH